MDGLRVSEGFFLFLSDRLSENSSELSTMKPIVTPVMASRFKPDPC